METDTSELMRDALSVEKGASCDLSNQQEETDSPQDFDPLFMDALPSDFASNSKLAAIASLLNDDEYQEEDGTKNVKRREEDSIPKPKLGGGKLKRRNRTNTKMTMPYVKPETKKDDARQATVGETQLFLKLWKI